MKNVVRAAAFAAALMVGPAAFAGEGVLVESVPAAVDKAGALAAAKEALSYREWRIVGEDADSVSASISRAGVDAKIKIKAAGSKLVYEESALGPVKLDFRGQRVPSVVETPSRWIDYLRADTTEKLMAMAAAPRKPVAVAPAAPPAPAAAGAGVPAPRTSVQRLAELKEMLDRGLISADEYAKKKDEILKAL